VKQIAASANRQQSTSNNILNNLQQLIDRISNATGLDQATKNNILDELATIVQQLTQSGSASSGSSGTCSNASDVSNDNAAASDSGDLDAA
jgi:ABC-type transporter Mla subunit MlaD